MRAILLNLLVAVIGSLILNAAKVPNGQDATSATDYTQIDPTVAAPVGAALAEE